MGGYQIDSPWKRSKEVGELSASVYNCLMFSARVTVCCVQKSNCFMKSSIACLPAVSRGRADKEKSYENHGPG